jgi:conjugative transfer signal peptidase TraF
MKRRVTLAAVGLAWGTLAALAAASATGLHVNTTLSMPAGIWQKQPYTGSLHDSDAVVVCLQPSDLVRRYIGPGSCPDGLEPLLKTVGAVAGDIVTLGPGGASVNGKTIPNTAPMSRDAAGRPLPAYPAGTYRVREGEVFLLSSHDPRSFDSRYFGPISTNIIVANATPILTAR